MAIVGPKVRKIGIAKLLFYFPFFAHYSILALKIFKVFL